MSGGDLVDYGWIRWPGGVLIALGVGAVMIARKPENQGTFVFSLALATLLGGLGLLYSLIMQEYTGTFTFILIPTALMLLISGLMWWGLARAVDNL
jgi:hypothetical protein